jgi:hypothetical protein
MFQNNMEVKYTNYDGDWDEKCPYCGKSQKEHQVNLGEYENVQHIHRQPCPEEQHQIRKQAVVQGIVTRTIILIYNFVSYLWGLIPFKEEAKLLWQGLKHVFVSIRAILYLNSKKPK